MGRTVSAVCTARQPKHPPRLTNWQSAANGQLASLVAGGPSDVWYIEGFVPTQVVHVGDSGPRRLRSMYPPTLLSSGPCSVGATLLPTPMSMCTPIFCLGVMVVFSLTLMVWMTIREDDEVLARP